MLREQVLCPFQIQTKLCVSCCWTTLELIKSVNVGYGSCCLQELRVVLGCDVDAFSARCQNSRMGVNAVHNSVLVL